MKTVFSTLPDYMNPTELDTYFNEFIKIYTKSDEILYSLEELNELAGRQWHTYEILSDTIKEQIENYIFSIINYDSYEIMDLILVIIPKLGLKNLYRSIIEKQSNIYNVEVIKLIDEAKNEYGETVANPYSGM